MRHELVRLAGLIDWARLEAHFASYYSEAGRPGLPIRLVVGLHLQTPSSLLFTHQDVLNIGRDRSVAPVRRASAGVGTDSRDAERTDCRGTINSRSTLRSELETLRGFSG
jgi:hypothetical protein